MCMVALMSTNSHVSDLSSSSYKKCSSFQLIPVVDIIVVFSQLNNLFIKIILNLVPFYCIISI